MFPDLARFLAAKGQPDFIAETSKDQQHYLVLYFLDRSEAWACRSKRSADQFIEFGGPYAVSRHELRMLRDLKAGKPVPAFESTGR